ncbi:prolyl endopeptidase-like [Protopterus annectens]|uniref:prolyl endopeptidase-like n=1 Tax=Protopterus annectens TaxID=7888 RepID=UPI001CFA535B|nr:prolyl endopeptidase-like [Protopterus annectens]
MANGLFIRPVLRIMYNSWKVLQITEDSIWGIQTYAFSRECHNTATRLKTIWPMERKGLGKRFFSQDFYQLEKEYSKAYTRRCGRLVAKIRKKLESVYNTYPFSSSNTKIHVGEHVFFEDSGCIYRYKNGSSEILEVLLNTEELGFQDASVQRIRLSPNQLHLAASIKHSDLEECTCVIVKLEETPEVCSVIPKVFSFEWANDDILFFVRQENLQCHEVFQLVFKAERQYMHLVYAEHDPRFFVEVSCTKDRRFLTINCNSKSTSEVWLINCHRPFDMPQLVQQRTPGVIYHVEHGNKELYIVTTYGNKISYKVTLLHNSIFYGREHHCRTSLNIFPYTQS